MIQSVDFVKKCDNDFSKLVLCFTEATSAAEKKRIQVEEGIYWLVHHCTTPCDIPQEWLQVNFLRNIQIIFLRNNFR